MIWLLVLGFSLISYQDSKKETSKEEQVSTFLGNSFCLFSAICYGFYATYLQIQIPKEEEAKFNFSYLLAGIGLFNAIAFLPALFVFDSTEIEVFSMPDKNQLILLTINGFFANFVFDYCYIRSVILNGPLETQLGLTLTFPISLCIDIMFKDQKFTWLYFLGSAFIFISFGVISFYNTKKEPEAQKEYDTAKEETN